jgi:ribosomal protein S18 acetylase RimI-like enzyme
LKGFHLNTVGVLHIQSKVLLSGEEFVIGRDGVPIGYIIYRLSKQKIEIIRLATAPDARRRGVGRLLVSEMIQKLNSPVSNREKIVVDVPDCDLVPQLFFRAMGFVAHQLEDAETYRFEYFKN